MPRIAILPTGGPSRDQGQVPREVSEVPLRHGQLRHLWRLPETASGPPALTRARAEGLGNQLYEEHMPNQACKYASTGDP